MSNSKDDKEPWATLTIANNIVELYEEIIMSLRESNTALKNELRKYKGLVTDQREIIQALRRKELH